MSDQEKRQRHLELLQKSRQRLEETELTEREPRADQPRRRREDPAPAKPAAGDDGVMMYRGRPVRRPAPGGGRRTTGASFSATAAKGAQRRGNGGGARNGDVREALERLNELYQDGLISRSDFDRKRQQILDRL